MLRKKTNLPPSILNNRTDSSKKIGSGTSYAIFKATLNGQTVAVKTVSTRQAQAYSDDDATDAITKDFELFQLNEAEQQKVVDRIMAHPHPNVHGQIGYGSFTTAAKQTFQFWVTEYLPKGDLEKWLKTKPKAYWPKRIAMLTDVAAGVAYLHCTLRVIHRDIKTSNVFITADGTLKIADFDLSVLEKSNAKGNAGTLHWAPPELFEQTPRNGPTRNSYAADTYSTGVVMLQIATLSKDVFTTAPRDFRQTGEFVRSGNYYVPLPAHTPSQVRAIITKSMEPVPSKRGTMREHHAQLVQLNNDYSPEQAFARFTDGLLGRNQHMWQQFRAQKRFTTAAAPAGIIKMRNHLLSSNHQSTKATFAGLKSVCSSHYSAKGWLSLFGLPAAVARKSATDVLYKALTESDTIEEFVTSKAFCGFC